MQYIEDSENRYSSCPKEGSRDYWYADISEDKGNSDIPYLVFALLLVGAAGVFLGSILASSTTVSTVKSHYCTRYTNTQEYIECIDKPMREIYVLMDKH